MLLHKNEQLYKLLAITVAMCPSVTRWCEEHVSEQLNMKCQDQIVKMQSGNIETYKVFFGKACPRFVSPTGPDLDGETDTSMLGYAAQQQAFVAEVRPLSAARIVASIHASYFHCQYARRAQRPPCFFTRVNSPGQYRNDHATLLYLNIHEFSGIRGLARV
jgi:hypothetical protein